MITLNKFINKRNDILINRCKSNFYIRCYLDIESISYGGQNFSLSLYYNNQLFDKDINLELYTNKESFNFFLNYIKGKKLIDLLRLGFEYIDDDYTDFMYSKNFWNTKIENLQFYRGSNNPYENIYVKYSLIKYSYLGPSFISYGLLTKKIAIYRNKKRHKISYEEWLKDPELIRNNRIDKLDNLKNKII